MVSTYAQFMYNDIIVTNKTNYIYTYPICIVPCIYVAHAHALGAGGRTELVTSYIRAVAKESWLHRETLRSICYIWGLVWGEERKRVRKNLGGE